MRILVVEDEPEIRELIRRGLHLHDETIQVVEAPNGMEAVHLLAATPPDAIMLDMLMPDMDGWEFLQILEALESSLPVVILTAVLRDNASLCGIMTAYPNILSVVNKPISLERLAELAVQFETYRK